MSAFDDLTLGEVDEIKVQCLNGLNISDDGVDPLNLAGGVMWATQRRDDPGLSWEAFRQKTRMGDIKAFSQQMQAEDAEESINP